MASRQSSGHARISGPFARRAPACDPHRLSTSYGIARILIRFTYDTQAQQTATHPFPDRGLCGPPAVRSAADVGAGTNFYPALLMLPQAEHITFTEYALANIGWLSENLAIRPANGRGSRGAVRSGPTVTGRPDHRLRHWGRVTCLRHVPRSAPVCWKLALRTPADRTGRARTAPQGAGRDWEREGMAVRWRGASRLLSTYSLVVVTGST